MIHALHRFLEMRSVPSFSAGQLRALQNAKLRRLVRHAFDNVPFYRDLFRSVRVSPEDIRGTEDLGHLPVISKNDLRAHPLEETTSREADSDLIEVHTSGSTGEPFSIFLDHDEALTRRLLGFRALLNAGLRPLDRFVIHGLDPAFRRLLPQRLGLFRSDHIDYLTPVAEQFQSLQRLRPSFYWTCPSVLRTLLREGNPGAVCRPRVVVSSAEVLNRTIRSRACEALGAQVLDFYVVQEIGHIAHECPAHEGLHIDADHVIVECLKDGRPAPPSTLGDVVVTGLDGFTMPIIRYRLGDLAALRDAPCSCGSALPMMSHLDGRDYEMVTLPSGGQRSPAIFDMVFKHFASIRQHRVIQEETDRLVLLLVCREELSERTLGDLRERLLEILGEPMDIEIRFVESIAPTGRKERLFTSRLSPVRSVD